LPFAFCAHRSGELDKNYAVNAAGCKENGIPFHAYHYLKATTTDEAVEEARHFYKAASAAEPLFYVADVEYGEIPASSARAITSAFIAELKRLGAKRTAIYVGHHLFNKFNLATGEVDYLWIPRYGKNSGTPETRPSYACDLWQFTSKGKVAGISGNVDLNQINGDKPLEFFTGEKSAEEQTKPITTDEGDEEGEESSMFTNIQLAAWALAVYAAKWVYWYGTCGYKCTTSLFTRKKSQYPSHYTSSRESGYKKDISAGKMCADCVGFIKAFFWMGGDLNGTNKYGANNCPDKSANGMYQLCKETGPISTIPDIPGLIVWKDGHIGIYVGNGYTVELKGFAYDCVKAKVTDGPWTRWGKLPATMLTYTDDGTVPAPVTVKLGDRTLRKGDEGDDVTELQKALKGFGYDLGTYGAGKDGIDGDYGAKTVAAVKAFQTQYGLEVDGIFGPKSYKALVAAIEAGTPEQPTPESPDDGGSEPDTSVDEEPTYILPIEGTKAALEAIQALHGGTLAAKE
jgi:hypothetical protein